MLYFFICKSSINCFLVDLNILFEWQIFFSEFTEGSSETDEDWDSVSVLADEDPSTEGVDHLLSEDMFIFSQELLQKHFPSFDNNSPNSKVTTKPYSKCSNDNNISSEYLNDVIAWEEVDRDIVVQQYLLSLTDASAQGESILLYLEIFYSS